MKIAILSMVSPDGGGVYQYTLSLCEAFKSYGKKNEYIQIRFDTFPKILSEEIVIPERKSSVFLKVKKVLHTFTGLVLGNLVPNLSSESLKDIDLVLSPIITLLPYHMKKPYIVTIHDFQQKYYPEFFTLKERIIRDIEYRTGKKANLVICESEYVKNDIMKFLRIPESRVKIIPTLPPTYLLNIEIKRQRLKEIKDKYGLPNSYLFYPAQFWYHKNHIKLLESLAFIKERDKEVIPLVLVGSKKNNFDNVMNKIKELRLENEVRYLGYAPNEDMPYLYNLSTALVMPTLFESVSMPIWEAFYLGVPVVSSNVCALPEQVEDAGLLFDPDDIEDMAEKIYRIWIDENLRKMLIQKGYERVKNMTLENYAKQWEKIIEEAIERIEK